MATHVYSKGKKKPISTSPPWCCPHQQHLPQWLEKNVVYNMSCLVCDVAGVDSRYVGETGGRLQKRTNDHARSIRKSDTTGSAWTQHYLDNHPTRLRNPEFKVDILDRPRDYCRRKISEAFHIADVPNSIDRVNRHDEGSKIDKLLLRDTRKCLADVQPAE